MTASEFDTYVAEKFGILPDHPFARDPETAVFRHPHNRKWFAIHMTIPKRKLGISEDGIMDVVNVKCAPELLSSFLGQDGVYPAYHMNRGHWLTLSLDGQADRDTIAFLLSVSFDLTKK